MANRAHFYAPIQNTAGDIQTNSTVRVLQPGTTTLISDPLYPDDETPTVMSNPFIADQGVVSIYMDTPQRVRLGVTLPGQSEVFLEDIDVLAVTGGGNGGGDSSHAGLGTNSTSVGSGAASAGAGSSAFGNSASAPGGESVSIGHGAVASGTNAIVVGSTALGSNTGGIAIGITASSTGVSAIAVGSASAASGGNSAAVGDNAIATGAQSASFGTSASSARIHATALGAQAITTEDNQVMLGTPSDNVRIPGAMTLKGANGVVYSVTIDNAGGFQSRYHVPPVSSGLLTGDDSAFDGGVGSWAPVSGCTIVSSSIYSYSGPASMQMTITAAPTTGPETNPSAASLKVAASAGHTYIARARGFMHGGDGFSFTAVAWIEFYDSADTLLSSSRGPTRALVLDGAVADYWSIVDVYAVAPLNTATASLRLGFPYAGAGFSAQVGDIYYWDEAQIYDVAVSS